MTGEKICGVTTLHRLQHPCEFFDCIIGRKLSPGYALSSADFPTEGHLDQEGDWDEEGYFDADQDWDEEDDWDEIEARLAGECCHAGPARDSPCSTTPDTSWDSRWLQAIGGELAGGEKVAFLAFSSRLFLSFFVYYNPTMQTNSSFS